MKLPRDVGGRELAVLLSKYGYKVTRQTGSHMRLTSIFKGIEHHITIPEHKPLGVGLLDHIVNEIAAYLEIDHQELIQTLFERVSSPAAPRRSGIMSWEHAAGYEHDRLTD
jgi:predicted RNA binding protein YcfA (HicA-like mRNA interferase family)